MKEKRVLVVERSGSDISYSNETVTNNLGKQEESIVLTGIFTTFNQKNRNGRIYESADFLPHIEALKEFGASEIHRKTFIKKFFVNNLYGGI